MATLFAFELPRIPVPGVEAWIYPWPQSGVIGFLVDPRMSVPHHDIVVSTPTIYIFTYLTNCLGKILFGYFIKSAEIIWEVTSI